MASLLIVLTGTAFGGSLDGVWKSRGYGYVFEISDKTLKGFEVTTRTCLEGFTAKRDSISEPGREAIFRTEDGDVYFVRAGDAGDHRRLHSEGSASDMRIDRLPGMPAVCHSSTNDTDPSSVKPSSRPGFRGPVAELIGPLTISAGETFTQALMGRVPHVTRIGENTQGVFSDVLVRRLPNGWTFGLPNEVYRNSEGRAFDGTGIPPDINVPVFAKADVAAGKDPALIKAIEILRKHY